MAEINNLASQESPIKSNIKEPNQDSQIVSDQNPQMNEVYSQNPSSIHIPAQIVHNWEERLPEFKQILSHFTSSPLPFVPNPELDQLHQQAIDNLNMQLFDDDILRDLIMKLIDSSNQPQSQLVDQIYSHLTSYNIQQQITKPDLANFINKIADRKALGIRQRNQNVFEDTESTSLWIWEVNGYPQTPRVKKERNLIGKIVKAIYKVITELEKIDPNFEEVTQQFDIYNKAHKSLQAIYERETSKKRKREEIKQEKLIKKQKIEEEKAERIRQREAEKQAKKQKVQEEKALKRQRQEEEKQAKLAAKEEQMRQKEAAIQAQKENALKNQEEKQKKEPSTPQKPANNTLLTNFFTVKTEQKPKPPQQASFFNQLAYIPPKTITNPCSEKPQVLNLEQWINYFKQQPQPNKPIQSTYIIIHDSVLVPYYCGQQKRLLNTSKNSLHIYSEINYDVDSEDELEEMNAEDLGEDEISNKSSDSMEEDLEDDDEKWMVPDGHLSESERGSDDEQVQLNMQQPEFKALVIAGQGENDEILDNCRAFSIKNESFPVLYHKVQVKVQKKDINDYLGDLIECGVGKANKKEILQAFQEMQVLLRHPEFAKAPIIKKIDEVLIRVKRKGEKGVYADKMEHNMVPEKVFNAVTNEAN